MSRLLVLLGNSGSVMSLLCAIHCALTPIILTLFPTIAGSWFESEAIEIGVMIASFLLGGGILLNSYRTHKSLLPFFMLFSGFALFFVQHTLLHSHGLPGVIINLVAASILILAQVKNKRLMQSPCACTYPHRT